MQQLLQTIEFPLLMQFIKKNPYTAGNYNTLQECVMPTTFIWGHTYLSSTLEAALFQKTFYTC